MARDPVLRAGIDWTDIATSLGKEAVQATTEGYKIGTSKSPGNTALTNGAVRLVTDSDNAQQSTNDSAASDTVKFVDTSGKSRYAILSSGSIAGLVDAQLGDQVVSKWQDIDHKVKDKLTAEIIQASEKSDLAIIAKIGHENQTELQVPEGNWNVISTVEGGVPLNVDINIAAGETTQIKTKYLGADQYKLNPDIADHLGYNPEIIKLDRDAKNSDQEEDEEVSKSNSSNKSDKEKLFEKESCSNPGTILIENFPKVSNCEDLYQNCRRNGGGIDECVIKINECCDRLRG
ncbi:hypothetical protein GF357_03270 [Candidatus Dojkabacteria bacterium]|nr:hypothetical protein [Candidatus Dojkabacteria bacterium]